MRIHCHVTYILFSYSYIFLSYESEFRSTAKRIIFVLKCHSDLYTLTMAFPIFFPWNSSKNAVGILSKPWVTCSRYFTLPCKKFFYWVKSLFIKNDALLISKIKRNSILHFSLIQNDGINKSTNQSIVCRSFGQSFVWSVDELVGQQISKFSYKNA